MYSDEDGIASKESEAIYRAQVRKLLYLTSALSFSGVSAITLGGGYAREELSWYTPGVLSKLSWPIISIYSTSLHWQEHPPKLYSSVIGGSLLAILITLTGIYTKHFDDETESWSISITTSLEICLAALLAIVQILFPRRPQVFLADGRLVDSESSSSAVSRYSMRWCQNALKIAGQSLSLDKLPALNYGTRSISQPRIVLSETSLWNHILSERFRGFAKQWTLMVIRSVITFGSPYCTMQLLRCLEQSGAPTNAAWIWMIGITVSAVSETVLHYHMAWIQWSEMGIPVRAQLIMAIYSKLLRVRDTKFTGDKPEATNLLSSDAVSFSKFTAVNYILPFSFVKFLFAILFLLRLLGWRSTVVAIVVTVGIVPIHKMVIKQERDAKKRLTGARDKKAKTISEAVGSLRQIKFSALEAQWEERIELCRQEEIKQIRQRFIATNIRSAWNVASPFLVTTAAILTYAYTEAEVSSSIIFPMIELLPHLQGTLGFVPVVFQDYFDARANAQRMESFLRESERKEIRSPSTQGSISFKNACIKWPSEGYATKPDTTRHFSLRCTDLEFPAGELSIIHGETGSGKSLLLASILGDVDLISGSIIAPSSHPVAYVSQTPWLQNATLKENILFGSEFDEIRYRKVLQACALETDLASLLKGDQTLIGLRGVKLSGGQRARVALGRALYSKAQLLVLDDILSALDSHIAKAVFKALTGEMCQGRTRILATHQVALCLPRAKYVAKIRNGSATGIENVSFMENNVGILESETSVQTTPPLKQETTNIVGSKTKSKLFLPQTDLETYKSYFAAAGGVKFGSLCAIGLCGKQLVLGLTTWTLGKINSTRPERAVGLGEDTDHGSPKFFLGLYLLASVSAVILELMFNAHAFAGSMRASTDLFRRMTKNVLRMPLLWLDNTSLGEILIRFNANIRQVDDLLLEAMSGFVDCMIKLFIVLAVGMYASIYTSILACILIYWCSTVAEGYVKARKLVKRGESEGNNEILEYFATSAAGASTIRAFGADRFIDQMHHRIDNLTISQRHFWIFNRWLGLQMSLSGILFTTGAGIILLLSNSVTDPSLMGFTLTFSMGLANACYTAVNNFGMLETYMNAASGVVSYSNLEPEPQGGKSPAEWPSKGEIQVNNLSLKYSTDLPLVINEISFQVRGGQRIGIVGRTGAGKSSLTLALLRFMNPATGSIIIDGIDISEIQLQHLRSRIGFVPQDPVLFSGTIKSNLDYFGQFSQQSLIDALRRVGLLAENDNEKSGFFTLDSQISAGGANMSQGQRQLLCLARIFLRGPKMVILDEATSAVDDKTDQKIQDVIQREFNRTLLVVAHRLRTVASFDKIIVIQEGCIAESGTPAELLNSKGVFYDMVQSSEDREFVTKIALEGGSY
ncbi:P-loop containing nucleoside triphosphate hydrolase protein [Penicillium angulare]|uniref:P-loop containing nucleoside triphosphate hydrolase protein n=1 Tax=Penicillium angulare TaxID=116970 RepID=UPI0025404985|nr:P-loop containing nucleoside triphosphate hydrolase protein [Penicillium angulare]KAJ5273160.1 P-loop containing nucleoside triphosphate hydrolase protein [Penicillium angulare]